MTTTSTTPRRPEPRDALPRLDRHQPKCGPVRKSRAARWRAFVLIAVHVLIGLHIAHWLITGSSLTPMEPSEAMQTTEMGRINAGFVLFVVLILGTLVFGRWFCGWACHVVALQDLCAWLLGRAGLKPRPVRSRLLVLAPFLVAGHMFFWPHLQRWWGSDLPPTPGIGDWEWHLTTSDFWATFPGPLMAGVTFLVVGFLIVWWLGAKGFCNFGCPYGAFFAVADRFASGKIKVTDACDACGHCTSVCTSNVRVHEEVAIHRQVVDPACMKCLDCVSVCPKDALYYGFGAPTLLRQSQQRIRARADFTWPEEIALAAVAWLATMAFRRAWFGEGVPFLLAVGLGVITAVFAVALLRLLRRNDLTFQHTLLKQGGRWRPAGVLAACGIGLWLLLAADCGVVRYFLWRAEWAEQSVAPWQELERRAQDLRVLDDHLRRAAAFTLLPDPTIHRLRGLTLRDLALCERDNALMQQAEGELQRALELQPDSVGALVGLADLLHLRQADDQAEVLLRRALELAPGEPGVVQRLEAIERERKR